MSGGTGSDNRNIFSLYAETCREVFEEAKQNKMVRRFAVGLAVVAAVSGIIAVGTGLFHNKAPHPAPRYQGR